MTIYDETLNEVLAFFEDLNENFKVALNAGPEGCLKHQMDRGRVQFLHNTTDKGKSIRRGINRNEDLIRALARKEFNAKACENLSNIVDLLSAAVDGVSRFDYESILESMTDAYAYLPDDYFFDNGNREIAHKSVGANADLSETIKRHEEWGKSEYKEYWGFPENKTKLTSRGQRMRSISEILIAESLYKYSIPFHYEEEIEVDGKKFAPDFTFEGWDSNKFYLDYFGMMSDAKYAKRNFLKLDDYYDIGLIAGDNLIAVFNSKGIMSVKVIEAIIENEVIPRL